MIEFIKNFFREDAKESSTRLQLIMCATTANLCVIATTYFFFKTGKDFSSQCALLSGILLGVASVTKTASKSKELTANQNNEIIKPN